MIYHIFKYLVLLLIVFSLRVTKAQSNECYHNFYSFLCDSLSKLDFAFEENDHRIFILDDKTLLTRITLFDEIECSMFYCKKTMDYFIEDGWSCFRVLTFKAKPEYFEISLRYNIAEGREGIEKNNFIYNIKYYIKE